MWEKVEIEERPKLQDPVLLVCLSTSLPQYRSLYSQGRELGKFLLKKMEFKRMATIYASALPPAVMISEEGDARLVSVSFYYHRGEQDVVLLAGDTTPTEEQYEFCDAVLAYARELGVKRLVSIGTRWAEAVAQPTMEPKVQGFATDAEGVKELEAYGVGIIKDEPAPFFASMIVALGGMQGIRGYKLSVDHGEIIPHPKALIEFLEVLGKMLKIDVDTADLTAKAAEMDVDLRAEEFAEPPRERSGVYG
jgi:proteasome assembly chaperone (PAC2) family protein